MRMATGESHPLASRQWIERDLLADALHTTYMGFVASVSDHMLVARVSSRLVSWNWRTGTKALVSFTSSNNLS